MDAQVLVEVGRVVQRDSLEALQVCGELVELGEAAAAFLFYADLDLADPPTLEFDPLCNDFLLQAGRGQYDSATANGRGTNRSLMMSL